MGGKMSTSAPNRTHNVCQQTRASDRHRNWLLHRDAALLIYKSHKVAWLCLLVEEVPGKTIVEKSTRIRDIFS